MSTLRRIAVRLLDFEWTILAAIVTASMVSARALWLGPGFAALFWLVRMSAGRGRPARTQADIPAALLVIMGLTSIWISIDRSQTIPTVLRLFLGIAFFYASIRSVNSELKIRNFLLGIAAVILGLSLLAPISVEWASTKIPLIPGSIYDRFTILLDDSIHRNVLSGFLLILLGPLLAFFLFAWHEARPWPKFLLTASASLGLSMLFLAQSRGALIALGLVFLLLIVLRFRRGWLLVPTSILGFILLVASPWRAQLLNMLASGVSLEGFEGRIEIWSRGIFMIQDFPITGIGMGLRTGRRPALPLFLLSPRLNRSHPQPFSPGRCRPWNSGPGRLDRNFSPGRAPFLVSLSIRKRPRGSASQRHRRRLAGKRTRPCSPRPVRRSDLGHGQTIPRRMGALGFRFRRRERFPARRGGRRKRERKPTRSGSRINTFCTSTASPRQAPAICTPIYKPHDPCFN